VTHDDPTRPDLDAAIDAVVPSLTEVSDDAVAASMRRTRVALAGEAVPAAVGPAASSTAWSWRLAAAAVVLAVGVFAISLWPRSTPRVPVVASAPPTAPAVTAAPPAIAPAPLAATPEAAPAVAVATPRRRRVPRVDEPVRAASAAPATPARRPDPLIALVRAVQAIPEDAWARGTTVTEMATPDVAIDSIAIAPLETPVITDAPAEPIAPGDK
jgi:hypothetical protein